LLALPILWYCSAVKAKLDASLDDRASEATAVRWIVMAERLANLQRLPVAAQRSSVEAGIWQRLLALRLYALAHADALADAPAATLDIEHAWNALLRERSERAPAHARSGSAPSGSAAANVTNATYRAITTVSASELSLESDPVLADLGDALDNGYFMLFASLASATEATQAGWRNGGLSLDDRVLISGLVSQARSGESTLVSDMANAYEHRADLEQRLDPHYIAALSAADALRLGLEHTVRAQRYAGETQLLTLRARALSVCTDAFLTTLQGESLANTAELSAKTRRDLNRLYAGTLLAIVVDFVAVLFAGRLIARRYRYELELAREQARLLSTEVARQRAEHARMLTEAQFNAVFDRSQMGIALLDRDGATVECNPALSETLGRTSPTIVPQNDARFAKLIAGFQPTYQYEGPLTRADGETRWAQITVSSIDVPQSEAVAAIAIVQDITERKEIDERLRFQAGFDDLTLLPNRAQFLTRLDSVIASEDDLTSYAVLFIDLDKFKLVNDTLGHAKADRVIAIAAQRLVAATRKGDIVARLHGDEFAVVVRDSEERAPGEAVAERIKKTFLAPVTIDGTSVVLTASVGIVPGLGGYRAAESVLRDADVAMYTAKKLGRSTAVTFDGAMHERLGSHMRMLTEISLAIEREEFRLVYQPIVDLGTGDVSGVEALMRWHHPTLGIVSPIEFIPVAEETDAIEYLGRLALRETCAMLARMDALGMPKIRASVNLAVPHLSNGEVVSDVRGVLHESGIAARRLMLEITESALLENGTRAASVLDELSALGVRLCIDDFGTGYSSLRYLHEYPIDALKIDRSFIYSEDGSLANQPIVHMLMTLARSLNMSVIAEGIESEEQRDALVASGCHFAQGYLFSKPLTEANLMRWIRAQPEPRQDAARITVA
jgi:diguanylate cyclase (GGDEF)-like protein/PAS domain S-box-containing protein